MFLFQFFMENKIEIIYLYLHKHYHYNIIIITWKNWNYLNMIYKNW